MDIKKGIKQNILLSIWCALLILFIMHKQWGKNYAIDFSADQRFTLSEASIHTLQQTQDTIEIEVFLPKGVNAGFNKLYEATHDLLKRVEELNPENITTTFIDPENFAGADLESFKLLVQQFDIYPVNIVDEDNKGKVTQKSVFPFALVSLNGYSYAINLLENQAGQSSFENLNRSAETLEYKLLDAIQILSSSEDNRIAFLEGHEELSETEVYDITSALSKYYAVDRGTIKDRAGVLDNYKAVIIAGPKKKFSEEEKFILDQYIMQGGKLVWLVEGTFVSADSLQRTATTFALPASYNLKDMLFNYGIRLNNDLVMDLQCAKYPINMSKDANKADFKPIPWQFAPLFSSLQSHPISNNLQPVKGEFVSTIDVLPQEQLKHTVLLRTSNQTNLLKAPLEIDLKMLEEGLESKHFRESYKSTAVLIEGVFTSVFQNRIIPPGILNPQSINKLNRSVPNKMLVISDREIIRNGIRNGEKGTQIIPLNNDLATGKPMYGNREFFVNAINYLTDNQDIMQLRMRRRTLHLLDKVEANENRPLWQWVNILSTLLLFSAFMFIFNGIRKYKAKK